MLRRPFVIDAIVIMPDHIYALWTMPTDDADYLTRWRNIKRAFTASIPEDQRPQVHGSRQRKQEQAIWHGDSFGRLRTGLGASNRDDQDFARQVDYIHYDPVKHGYVQCPADWQHSKQHSSLYSTGCCDRRLGCVANKH